MPEILFPGVTTGTNKPGRKLTKSLFRQILLEDPEWHVVDSGDFGNDGSFLDLPLSTTGHVVIGWVNYFWKGCYPGKTILDNQLVTPYPRMPRVNVLHVLWKKGNDYRRCFVSEDSVALFDEISEMQQLYLGEFSLFV